MNQRLIDVLVHAAIVGALAAYSVAAPAAPLTFKVCDPANTQKPTFKAPPGTDKLEVRCPDSTTVVFTIVGCVGPKVTRVGTDYTVTCAKWNRYDMVPKPQ